MTIAVTEATQLRCRSKLHGIVKQYPGKTLLEVRCKDKWCVDRSKGVVVLHYFNLATGELDHTKRFQDPKAKGGYLDRKAQGTHTSSTPVGRSSQRKVEDNG